MDGGSAVRLRAGAVRSCARGYGPFAAPERQREADDDQTQDREVYSRSRWSSCSDDGKELEYQLSAGLLYQQQQEHERNQAAIPREHDHADQRDDEVRLTDERKEGDYGLRAGGRIGVDGNSICGARRVVPVEDRAEADGALDEQEQPENHERELVTSISIIGVSREKPVEHERASLQW